jgi:Ca2+-binding EF-hand superfamily protein
MKRTTAFVTAIVGALAFSIPAIAAEGDFVKVDKDGNGQVSFDEGKAMHPDWTEAAFKTLDTDGSGTLSQQEYDVALNMMKQQQKTN